jgi:hypothetical protein
VSNQPEALRLADILEKIIFMDEVGSHNPLGKIAAAELRRLHAEVERLRVDAERYRFIRDADRSDCITPELSLYAMESLDEYVDAAMEDEARTAIAKAEGQA